MPRSKKNPQHLHIYLIKGKHRNPKEILTNTSKLSSYNMPGIGILFIRPSSKNPPPWLSFFKGHINLEDANLFNSSTSAILIVKCSNRLFALSFGHAKSLIKKEYCEERFGLIVTLSSCSRFRKIDNNTFDAVPRRTQEQAIRDIDITDFGFDIEQILLRSVTGIPDNPSLGKRMSGIDALTVNIETDLDNLIPLLEEYYKIFQRKNYRKKHPWVDNIREVTENGLLARLDDQLVSSITSEKFDKLWMAIPEVIDWSDVSGFRYSRSQTKQLHVDIDIDSFLDAIKDKDKLTIKTLHNRRVYSYGTRDYRPKDNWNIYTCLYHEVELNKGTYILNGGKWYKIESYYRDDINRQIDEIPTSNISLPPYSEESDRTETVYNKRVHKTEPEKYALMDSVPIMYGGGHSRFEFCDLYSISKQIIHVKRYGQSSVLSHLFSQGMNSAEPFKRDPEFRRLVNRKLPRSHKINNHNRRLQDQEYEVIFAIISRSEEERVSMPFFSRINLKRAANELRAYGYRVSLAKIPISPPPTQSPLPFVDKKDR